MKSGKERISPYLPPHKRWMQIDVRSDSLSVVVNCKTGTVDDGDLKELDIPINLRGNKTAIQIGTNQNNVQLTVFSKEPIQFNSRPFINLLHKLYNGYRASL